MLSNVEIILQLLLSGTLGGLIGLERERRSWFAGLRTHMLVCMGSTLIMIVSRHGFEDVIHTGLIVLDPSRMAAQVVSGIGFLGAGTILFWKNKIKGLTTAASLWTVAAVGLAVGGNLYFAAIATTILILVVLAAVQPIEKRFFKRPKIMEINFSIDPGFSLLTLDKILIDLDLRSTLVDLQIEKTNKREQIHLVFESQSDEIFLQLVNEIKNLPKIQKVEIVE